MITSIFDRLLDFAFLAFVALLALGLHGWEVAVLSVVAAVVVSEIFGAVMGRALRRRAVSASLGEARR
ncbi:hypothetical protein [Pseudonocardia sp. HH130630-07]|uniref:hypothetical protein n=1 Tax=Pseudonocardia sp. HH130630-07 TaxID=1690815 RepID=UPI0008151B48|nr:hypothetical protein [Pseudonocardia sp. HH130630-07]ANY10624.1 hypothetical protein AFB00_29910 [Pseudonocardia sp. HH130630-07]